MHVRLLPVKLTEEEVALRSANLAAKVAELDDVVGAAKDIASEYREKKKQVESDVRDLAQVVRDRAEEREVQCLERKDLDRKQMLIVRNDTGEVVASRALTFDELQMRLFDKPPGGGDPDYRAEDPKDAQGEVAAAEAPKTQTKRRRAAAGE